MKLKYLIIASLILGGCTLGPDYKKPDPQVLQLDDHFHGQKIPKESVEETSDPSVAALNWRAIYTDGQLQALIDSALVDNLDLSIARSRLRQAKSLTTIAGSNLWPTADADLSFERELDDGTIENTYSVGALLSWELDIWGINRRALEASKAEQAAAEYSLYAIQVALIGAIADTYFILLDLDNQLSITYATVESRREALRILRLRKKNGIISGIEVAQAQLSLAEALQKTPQLINQKNIAENELNILLGRAPGEVVRSSDLNSASLPDNLPAGLPSELLLRRPDLLAAEQLMIAANASIGVAKGSMFPRIKLTGEFGRQSADFSNLLDSNSNYFDFVSNLTSPLFNAGANTARYASSKEDYQQSLLSYRASIIKALTEVDNGFSAYTQSQAQEQATKELLQAANEYLRLAQLRYRNGVLGYIDVLDAQRQQFDADLALSKARRDRLQATSFIYKALGGGWENTAQQN